MLITYWLNGKKASADIEPGMMLYDFLRSQGCYSVKCGCETTNCGLCTVWVDDLPVLSCAVLAVRIDGCRVTTLEGLQEEAKEFAFYMGQQGADQCGFCKSGLRHERLVHGAPLRLTDRRRDQGIFIGQSLPLYGIYEPYEGHQEIF